VDDAALDAAAFALAARLASGPHEAYARTKALMRIWRDRGRVEARRELYEISMPLFDKPDVQSALRNAVDAINAGLPIPAARFPASS
jgi:enoyl-CoA hydratase/carnithine racemase